MKNSALVQTIEALTASERKELGVFLQSYLSGPVKNGKQIWLLFTQVEQFVSDNNAFGELSKPLVFSRLFPGKSYRAGNFENLMTGLMAGIRRFILEQSVRKRWGPVLEELAMAEMYRSRDLPDLARRALQRAKSERSGMPHGEQAQLSWWTEKESFLQSALGNDSRNAIQMHETLRAFLSAVAPELLQLAAVYVSQQRRMGHETDAWGSFFKGFRTICRDAGYFDLSGVRFLDEAIRLLENTEDMNRSGLDEFNRRFMAHFQEMGEREAKVVAAFLRNAFIKILSQYTPVERLVFFRQQLEAGLLYENGRLQATTLLNLMKVALDAGDAAWLRHFLTEHRNKIIGPQKENVRLIAEAQYHFSLQEWQKVNTYLNVLRRLSKLRDLSLEKLMRLLEIKAAFELEQFEEVGHQLNSFRIFLKRHQTSIGVRNFVADLNFIQITRKLLKFAQNQGKNHFGLMAKCLAKCENPDFFLADRIWLIGKLLDLTSNRSKSQ